MSIVKRALDPFKEMQEAAELLVELAETAGVELFRVRSFNKGKMKELHGPQSLMPQSLYGFELFNIGRGENIVRGKLTLYPGVDHYCYGYIPDTPHNRKILAAFVGGGDFTADDKYAKEAALETAKELGYDTVRSESRKNLGLDAAREERKKESRRRYLEGLKQKEEDQKLEDEIAELEAKLNLKVEEPVVEEAETPEPEEEVVEEPVVEPAEEEKPAPKRTTTRQLSGKKVQRKS